MPAAKQTFLHFLDLGEGFEEVAVSDQGRLGLDGLFLFGLLLLLALLLLLLHGVVGLRGFLVDHLEGVLQFALLLLLLLLLHLLP